MNDFADAVMHDTTWNAYQATHPDGAGLSLIVSRRLGARTTTAAQDGPLDPDPPMPDLDTSTPPARPVAVVVPEPAPRMTWRTLADVPDDPPRPLLLGLLEPDGPTLAYAAPGTGKGTTGAWIAVELQRLGMRPVIYDAERRPREWSRRVGGLGGDRSGVVYLDPTNLPPKSRGKPLWEVAPDIGQAVQDAGGDLLIVDSIMPATGVGEERLRSDAQVPFLWVAALDALGIPSLSFGHPPKGQPEGEPFGSFAWVAAMRLTWLGTKAEGDGHQVRWRPKKRNERGHIPGVRLTVVYADDGRPCEVIRADDEEGRRDWLLAALVGGPRGVADLADERIADMEDPPAGGLDALKDRFARALNRMAHDGWVTKEGTSGRNVRWALKYEGTKR